MLRILVYTVALSDNFKVGLTDTQPTPGTVPSSYTLCGQYSGAVTAGETATVTCATGLPEFRYVIVLLQDTGGQFCEIEVMGM